MVDHGTDHNAKSIHFLFARAGQNLPVGGVETVVFANSDGLVEFLELGRNTFAHGGEAGVLTGVVNGQTLELFDLDIDRGFRFVERLQINGVSGDDEPALARFGILGQRQDILQASHHLPGVRDPAGVLSDLVQVLVRQPRVDDQHGNHGAETEQENPVECPIVHVGRCTLNRVVA